MFMYEEEPRSASFYTVFPNDEKEPPQDFKSYDEAKEYGETEFGECNYVIEKIGFGW